MLPLLFAEFERELISDRNHEGLGNARSYGKRLGRPKGIARCLAPRLQGVRVTETNRKLPSKMPAYESDQNVERIVEFLHPSLCPTAKALSPGIPNL